MISLQQNHLSGFSVFLIAILFFLCLGVGTSTAFSESHTELSDHPKTNTFDFYTPSDSEQSLSYSESLAQADANTSSSEPTAVIDYEFREGDGGFIPGDTIMFDGSQSDGGGSEIVNYEWGVSTPDGSLFEDFSSPESGVEIDIRTPGVASSINHQSSLSPQDLSDMWGDYDVFAALMVETADGQRDNATIHLQPDTTDPIEPSDIIADPETGLPTEPDGYQSVPDAYHNPSYRFWHSNLPQTREMNQTPELPYLTAFGQMDIENDLPFQSVDPRFLHKFLPAYPVVIPNVVSVSELGFDSFAIGQQPVTTDPYSASLFTDGVSGLLSPGGALETYNRTFWSEEHEVESLAELASHHSDAPPDLSFDELNHERMNYTAVEYGGDWTVSYMPQFYNTNIHRGLSADGIIQDANVSYLTGKNVADPQFEMEGGHTLPRLTGSTASFKFHADFRLEPSELPENYCDIIETVPDPESLEPLVLDCVFHEVGTVLTERTMNVTDTVTGDVISQERYQNQPLSNNTTFQDVDLSSLDNTGEVNYEMEIEAFVDRHEFTIERKEYQVDIDPGKGTVAVDTDIGQELQVAKPNEVTLDLPAGTTLELVAEDLDNNYTFSHWELEVGTNSSEAGTREVELFVDGNVTADAIFINENQGEGETSPSTSAESANNQSQNSGELTFEYNGQEVSGIWETIEHTMYEDDDFWELTDEETVENVTSNQTGTHDSIEIYNTEPNADDLEVTQIIIDKQSELEGGVNDVIVEVDRPGVDNLNTTTPADRDIFLQQPFITAFGFSTDDTPSGIPTIDIPIAALDIPWGFTSIQRYEGAWTSKTPEGAFPEQDWRNLELMEEWELDETQMRGNHDIDFSRFEEPVMYNAYRNESVEALPDPEDVVPELPEPSNELLEWFETEGIQPEITEEGSVFYPQLLEQTMFYKDGEPDFIDILGDNVLYRSLLEGEPVSDFPTDFDPSGGSDIGERIIDQVNPAPMQFGGFEGTEILVDEDSIPFHTSRYIEEGTIDSEPGKPMFIDRFLVRNTVGELSEITTIHNQTVEDIDTYTVPEISPSIEVSQDGGNLIIEATYEDESGVTRPLENRELAIVSGTAKTVVTDGQGRAVIDDPGTGFVQVEFGGDPVTDPCHDFDNYDDCVYFRGTTSINSFTPTDPFQDTLYEIVWRFVLLFPVFFIWFWFRDSGYLARDP